MGAAAVIKNFPLEFKIADKKDEIDINSKKGNVILLRSTARSNFPSISLKPGEIRNFLVSFSSDILILKGL